MRKILMFVIGGICGATIGTAVAMLISPMSGEALREEAHARFEAMMEDAQTATEARRVELEAEYAELTTRH